MSIAALIASKPDGAFVMMGVNANWCHQLGDALHPMSKLLIIAEDADALAPVQELPQRDIRAAVHCQDFASFIPDVAHQRFVGLLLAATLSPEQLTALSGCLLPGGVIISARPLILANSDERWYELPQLADAGAGTLSAYVKGPKVRRRGAVRRATRTRD